MSDPPAAPPPPPPAPPSPPTEPGYPPTTLAWLGSIALLAVVTLPQFFLPTEGGDDSVPYRIGRVLGAAFFGILIGYFIWWLIRRSRPGSAKWSPWVFVIAAGIATLSLFSSVAQRAAEVTSAPESAQEAEAPYEGPAASYFVEPEGYEYEGLAPDVAEQLEAQFTSDPEVAEHVSEFEGRHVLKGAQPVGATIVVLMDVPPEEWDETQEGFVRGFEGAGEIALEPQTIGGFEALTAELPQGVAHVFLDRNLVIQVIGFTEGEARDIAEAQATALED